MLDTAGRMHIDDELMRESAEIRDIAQPHETLLVADSLTGQDAVNVARSFDERIGITGIVLTRVDGDGRGGAALSMRAVTGKPIKLIGVGERWDALEDFHPQRIAARILGMGDVVSLVEKAAQTIDVEKAQKIAAEDAQGRVRSARTCRADQADAEAGRHGRHDGHAAGRRQAQAADGGANIDDKVLKRQTRHHLVDDAKERRNPKMLDGKRKRRVAAARAPSVEDVNKLLKMHRQMADMMKMMGKNKGMMQRMAGAMGWAGWAARRVRRTMEQMQAELRASIPRRWSSCRKELREDCRKAAACRALGGRRLPTAARPAGTGRRRAALSDAGLSAGRRSSHAAELETERLRLRPWREDGHRRRSRTFCANEDARYLGGVCGRDDAWRRMADVPRPLGAARLRQLGDRGQGERCQLRAMAACGIRSDGRSPRSSGACAPHFRAAATPPRRRGVARAYAYRELGWPTAVSYIAAGQSCPPQRVADRLGAVPEKQIELRGSPVGRLSPPGVRSRLQTLKQHQENDMSVKIRLSRGGAKKRPYYYIVVAESPSPRDGRYIEQVGTHNPLLPKDHAERVKLNLERCKHWLSVGAQPTDRVARFLDAAGLMKRVASNNPDKAKPKKKRQEREAAEAAAAAEKAKAGGRGATRELTCGSKSRTAPRRRRFCFRRRATGPPACGLLHAARARAVAPAHRASVGRSMPFKVRSQVVRHSGFDICVVESQSRMQSASVLPLPPE